MLVVLCSLLFRLASRSTQSHWFSSNSEKFDLKRTGKEELFCEEETLFLCSRQLKICGLELNASIIGLTAPTAVCKVKILRDDS